MVIRNNVAVEQWWNRTALNAVPSDISPFPGKSALIVGAGISMDLPTALPSGAELTKALLRHLLDERAAEELLSVFQDLGRQTPRLEHILDVACNGENSQPPTSTENPKNLLRIFEQREPNPQHRIVAGHLVEKRCWVITTNFDDCIEQAAWRFFGQKIPVHIFSSDTQTLDILNSEVGTDWGLVKLHGTIQLGIEGLGATLSALIPRLPTQFREHLAQIFESVDVVVVAGYSGTDHFDVNAWIRDRMNARSKPRLIWIHHAETSEPINAYDDSHDPFKSWFSACAGSRVLQGQTKQYLQSLLGQPLLSDLHEQPKEQVPLPNILKSLYCPTSAQRHLNGAYLCSAVGLGQLAEEEYRRYRHAHDAKNENHDALFSQILGRMGWFDEAHQLLANLSKFKGAYSAIQRAKMYRQQNQALRALKTILNGYFGNRTTPEEAIELNLEAIECLLDCLEHLQRYWFFRTKLIRRVSGWFVATIWTKEIPHFTKETLSIIGKVQLMTVRLETLVEDHDEIFGPPLWRLLHEQIAYPDFYGDTGPLIPGYYLIGLSTHQEEDRMADMLYMYLMFVRVLLADIQRRWPNGSRSFDHLAISLHPYWSALEQFLSSAEMIANSLREPHLRLAVANAWIKADRILKGISYWRPQRLYL